MKLKQKHWILIVGVLIIVIVLFMMTRFFLEEKSKEEDLLVDWQVEQNEVESKDVQQEEEEEIVMKVDVKGAVIRPGLYLVDEGDRILDVIEQAGGFANEANQNGINLAQRVEDQMVIYVPIVGKEGQNSQMTSEIVDTTSSVGSDSKGKININKASETELETITGIGPSKAAAILQYRSENGSFKNIEELKNISGIGEKTYEKLKDEVTI